MRLFRRRKKARSRRERPTVTWLLPADSTEVPEDPVTALKSLPDGRMFLLDEYQIEGVPRQWVTVGYESHRDIVLEDETVSGLHCLLLRHRHTLRVYAQDADSKNGLRVNLLSVHDGLTELTPGSWLLLGRAKLLACGRLGAEQKPLIPAADIDELLRKAVPIYGDQEQAARAFGVTSSRLSRWLTRGYFARTG